MLTSFIKISKSINDWVEVNEIDSGFVHWPSLIDWLLEPTGANL